jgi:hypothetical protein
MRMRNFGEATAARKGRSARDPHSQALLLRPLFSQRDLVLEEIHEFDPLRLKRLRVERGFGQSWQGVGLEKDRALVGDNEVRTGISPTMPCAP